MEVDLQFIELVRIVEDRLLTLLVRDRNNLDYCFFSSKDSVIETPSIQSLVYPLTLLTTEKHLSSILYGEEMPIRWSKRALTNIFKLQNSNGSFGDKSKFYWTPILVYYAILSFRKLSVYFESDERKQFKKDIIKAGSFLCNVKLKNYLRVAENIVALNELFKLTGDRTYEKVSVALLLELLEKQHKIGFIESGSGFDVRKHFVLLELLSKYHFSNKSDLCRGILKSGLPLLYSLQRPDGSLENEIFEKEDFLTPPGYLIHMEKEFKDVSSLVDGMIDGTVKLGRRIIPYQDLLHFSLSTSRLFSTFELLKNRKKTIHDNHRFISDRMDFFEKLSILIVERKNYKAFINPNSSRVKIFGKKESNFSLIYGDSGFMLTIDGDIYVQSPSVQNHSLVLSQNQITFSSTIEKRERGILELKRKKIKYERSIEFCDDRILLTSKFYLNDLEWEEITFHRIYRKLNRSFRPEDIKIPSREDLEVEHILLENSIINREIVYLEDEKWCYGSIEDETHH